MDNQQVRETVISIVKNSSLITEDYCISVKVLAVDEQKRTVKVQELANTSMIHESVQLQAIEFGGTNVATGFCLLPAVGSVVLIEMFDNNELLYHVTAQEKIEKLLLNIGTLEMEVAATGVKIKSNTCEFNMDSTGFELKNAGITLASILLELINQIIAAQIVVTTPAGPGTGVLNPTTIAALGEILVKVNTVLK
jgi:hypothetical protein